MDQYVCLSCGNIISSDNQVTTYLIPQNDSWTTESSTPFALNITSCCRNENCVKIAWEQAKLSTIGEVEKTANIQSSESVESSHQILEKEEETNDQLEHKFDQSDIAKEMERLWDEKSHLSDAEYFNKSFHIKTKILDLVPSHFSHWIKTVGDVDGYYDACEDIWTQLVRGYVVLLDENRILHVLSIIEEINNLSNNTFYDMEIIEHEVQSFIADMKVFRKIMGYIRENPMTPQNKLYKALSLEGRKTLYMLEYAHGLDVILRIRHGNTWLLQACQ